MNHCERCDRGGGRKGGELHARRLGLRALQHLPKRRVHISACGNQHFGDFKVALCKSCSKRK
jgi:hypothetical protein